MQGDFFLTNWFLEMMRWVYEMTGKILPGGFGSVVITIVLCTLFLRVLTIFSDIKTRKSSADMALIQPELQKIQKKYANDPRRAQVEQNKYMKEKGVSMWGSCLPLLITMPLFFCFFAAFRYWGYEMTLRLLVDDNAAGLFKSFQFLWVHNIWQPDNGLIPVVANGSTFLSTAGLSKLLFLRDSQDVWQKLVDMGIALKSVSGGLEGYKIINTDASVAAYNTAMQVYKDMYPGLNNGWFLWAILAGGTNFLSAWLMQKSQPQPTSSDQAANQAAKSSKWMMYMFPVMSFVFCLSNNTAFAVYWTFSSVLMIVINFILNKKFPRPAAVQEDAKK